MKKLLITLLLFCFYVAQGAHGAMIVQKFSSGCTVHADSITGTSGLSLSVGNNGYTNFFGIQFAVSESYTICGVDLYLEEVGDTSGLSSTFTVYIYSDDSDEPGSEATGTESDAVNVSSIQGTESAYNFSNMSYDVTSGNYWIVLAISSTNTSNYTKLHLTNNDTGIENNKDSEYAVGPWANANASYSGKFQVYTQ